MRRENTHTETGRKRYGEVINGYRAVLRNREPECASRPSC